MLRILHNTIVFLLELTAIAGISFLALQMPFVFAALTMLMVLTIGSVLEWLRLRHELPFFFADKRPGRLIVVSGVAVIEVVVKSVLAGAAALLTFAGSDVGRLQLMAVLLALCLLAGTGLLRRCYLSFNVRPMRWGYFRLAVPMGVLFSFLVQGSVAADLISVSSLRELAGSLVFDLPEKPSLAQISDLAFHTKQIVDGLVVDFVTRIAGPNWAAVAAVVVSLNVLTGFVIAIYAVIVTEGVLRLEGLRRSDAET